MIDIYQTLVDISKSLLRYSNPESEYYYDVNRYLRIMKMSRPVEIMLDDVPSMRGGRQKKSYLNRTRRRNKSTI
jgi:hypothetical protein